MLGIDVSKNDLSCALLDPTTRRTLWQGSVPNSAAGLQELLARTPAESPWVVEPTGRYSSTVVQLGRAAGRQVLLAQPKKAQSFLRSIQSRAKTDRLDSYGLARYALAHALPEYPVKPALVEQLDQLLAARKGIAAHLSSLQLQLGELPHAAVPLQAAITALQEQRQALDRQIASLTTGAEGKEHFPAAVRLQAVPGIGPITAAAVVSRLTAKQFAHPDQFVAYVGLDISVRQSGKRAGNRGLTKEGDAELRRLLYLCAQASLRCKSSPFKAQYERELAKGLRSTGALCAVARKLARLCWSMVRHGSEYDPERVYQQELPKVRK